MSALAARLEAEVAPLRAAEAADPEAYRDGVLRFVPPKKRRRAA